MRSPAGAFDLRAALSAEVQAAIDELNSQPEAPGAAHTCRVRIKRARAIARIGRAGAPGLASVFDDTAHQVMRTLARARSASALARTARKFAKQARGKEARAFEAMSRTLDAMQPLKLNPETVHAGLKDLLALAQVWPEPSPRQIQRGARRVSGKARRAFRRARAGVDETLRHDWRKREKDRLFAVMALGKSWPGRRKRKLGAKLGDLLARERDAVLLLRFMNAAPVLANEERGSEHAVRRLQKQIGRLARQADKVGAQLHRSRK